MIGTFCRAALAAPLGALLLMATPAVADEDWRVRPGAWPGDDWSKKRWNDGTERLQQRRDNVERREARKKETEERREARRLWWDERAQRWVEIHPGVPGQGHAATQGWRSPSWNNSSWLSPGIRDGHGVRRDSIQVPRRGAGG